MTTFSSSPTPAPRRRSCAARSPRFSAKSCRRTRSTRICSGSCCASTARTSKRWTPSARRCCARTATCCARTRAATRCGLISACSTRMRRSFCASGCSRARWMNFTRRCARATARRSWPIPSARGGTTARSARWCSSCTESCRRSRTWTAGSRRRSSFGTICRRAWRIRSTGRCCFLWCGVRRSTVPHCCAARLRRWRRIRPLRISTRRSFSAWRSNSRSSPRQRRRTGMRRRSAALISRA